MNVGCRRNAAVLGSLSLLCSLVFATWTPQTSGVTADLHGVCFPESTEVGYVAGGNAQINNGVVLKTTDGGGTWVTKTSGSLNGLNAVYFKDNSTGFAVGLGGLVLKTTSGGDTWTTVSVPTSVALNSVQFPENGDVGFIVGKPEGDGFRVLKTTDGGDNWTALTFPYPAANATVAGGFATNDIGVAVGTRGMGVRTLDGTNFEYIGLNTIGDMYAVAFKPGDKTKAYAVGTESFPSVGVVRYSPAADTATVWQDCGAPSATVYLGLSLCRRGNAAYIVGMGGVIGKTTGGTVFLLSPSGLLSTFYGVCFPTGESTGYVVGEGGLILKTTDGGGTVPGVAEGKVPATSRAGIRVVSNPSRLGIALRSDADVPVTVFDASGRALMSRAATKGLNFLPVRKAGAYFVKAGAQVARVVVTD
jgi:photosystem II stability/assembly factor-like uncharacterized protein